MKGTLGLENKRGWGCSEHEDAEDEGPTGGAWWGAPRLLGRTRSVLLPEYKCFPCTGWEAGGSADGTARGAHRWSLISSFAGYLFKTK